MSSTGSKTAVKAAWGIGAVVIIATIVALVVSNLSFTVEESNGSKKERLDADNAVAVTPYNQWRDDYCGMIVNLDKTMEELAKRHRKGETSVSKLARSYTDDVVSTFRKISKPLVETQFDSIGQIPADSLIADPIKASDRTWNGFASSVRKANDTLDADLNRATEVASKPDRKDVVRASQEYSSAAEEAVKKWVSTVSQLSPHTAPTSATQKQFLASKPCKALEKLAADAKKPAEPAKPGRESQPTKP